MGLRINTNISSLQAQRQLNQNTTMMNRALERLASGSRINRAGDDAAGLAISEGLDAQVRGLRQSVRNANDSLGFLQTAEGALAEITNITQRLRELGIQAANGAIGDSERGFLDEEAKQLVSEFSRIANQTEFNGTQLLDGSFVETDLQVGVNKGETISFTIGDARAEELGAIVRETNGMNSLSADDEEFTLNGHTVEADTDADDKSPETDEADHSAIAVAAGINNTFGEHGVRAEVKETTGTLQEITFTDLNNNALNAGELTINGVDIADEYDSDISDNSALVAAINDSVNGITASVNNDDEVVLTAEDGRNIQVAISGSEMSDAMAGGSTGEGYFWTDGSVAATSAQVRTGQIELESADEITIGDTNNNNLGFDTDTLEVNDDTVVSNIDLSTQDNAADALLTLDKTLSDLNSLRADLGAVQSRLESVNQNLSIGIENLSAAFSQVRDADMARETAELTKGQILQQAGVAVLGQANTNAQVALGLLDF